LKTDNTPTREEKRWLNHAFLMRRRREEAKWPLGTEASSIQEQEDKTSAPVSPKQRAVASARPGCRERLDDKTPEHASDVFC
jgi:hypothetical protein